MPNNYNGFWDVYPNSTQEAVEVQFEGNNIIINVPTVWNEKETYSYDTKLDIKKLNDKQAWYSEKEETVFYYYAVDKNVRKIAKTVDEKRTVSVADYIVSTFSVLTEEELAVAKSNAITSGLDKLSNTFESFSAKFSESASTVKGLFDDFAVKVDDTGRILSADNQQTRELISKSIDDINSHVSKLTSEITNVYSSKIADLLVQYEGVITRITQHSNDMDQFLTKLMQKSDEYLQTKYETSNLIVEAKTYLSNMTEVLSSINASISSLRDLAESNDKILQNVYKTAIEVTTALEKPSAAYLYSEVAENVVNVVSKLLPKQDKI